MTARAAALVYQNFLDKKKKKKILRVLRNLNRCKKEKGHIFFWIQTFQSLFKKSALLFQGNIRFIYISTSHISRKQNQYWNVNVYLKDNTVLSGKAQCSLYFLAKAMSANPFGRNVPWFCKNLEFTEL